MQKVEADSEVRVGSPRDSEKIRVTHVITGLDTGGAEMMLYRLVSKMERAEFDADVVSLIDRGCVGPKIEATGIAVMELGMSRGVPSAQRFRKLREYLVARRPHVVQTWLYHADLAGGLAAWLAGRIPVVWGLHQSNLHSEVNKPSTMRVARLCSWLSWRLPARIVCCSRAARDSHLAYGYDGTKMEVIENGFDLTVFKPDQEARRRVREELGIERNAVVVGLISRFEPQKDHENFVHSAALLHTTNPNVHFVMCGHGIFWSNRQLTDWIRSTGIRRAFHLLGRRDDIARIAAALDVLAHSSVGEGFPIVVGEAMACGVPCVVTDVGDSALLVGDTGRVVPSRDSAALASALREMIDGGKTLRQKLGALARVRIARLFSLDVTVARYEAMYRKMAS